MPQHRTPPTDRATPPPGLELRPRHACADCARVVPWSRPEHARAAVLSLLHTAFAGKLGGTAPACLARLLTGARGPAVNVFYGGLL